MGFVKILTDNRADNYERAEKSGGPILHDVEWSETYFYKALGNKYKESRQLSRKGAPFNN